jgi:hypothetical protein
MGLLIELRDSELRNLFHNGVVEVNRQRITTRMTRTMDNGVVDVSRQRITTRMTTTMDGNSTNDKDESKKK